MRDNPAVSGAQDQDNHRIPENPEAPTTATPRSQPVAAASSVARKAAFASVALLVSSAFACAGLEITARLLWQLPPSMADFRNAGMYARTPRGCGLTPGFRQVFSLIADHEGYPVSINSSGMRGPEIAPRSDGESRILVVGDSLPFGYGVAEEDTLCQRLQSRMTREGRRAVVGNGGIPGLGNLESARRIGDLAPAFDPDAIVLCIYLGNDAIDNRTRDVEVVGGLRFVGSWAMLMRTSWRARMAARSKACLWIETFLVEQFPDRSLLADAVRFAQADDSLVGFPGNNPPDSQSYAGLFLDTVSWERAWPAGAPAAMPRAMDDFRRALLDARDAASGKPVLALILPTLHHLDDENYRAGLAAAGLEASGFRRGLIQERITSLCAELRVPCVDATAHLEALPDHSSLFLEDRGHLSPLGNDKVAELLAQASEKLLGF